MLPHLPLEIRFKILDMAVDYGRWEDLAWLEGLMRCCKDVNEAAVPRFWKVCPVLRLFRSLLDLVLSQAINLYDKDVKQLSSIASELSLETRQLVRNVSTYRKASTQLALDKVPHLFDLYLHALEALPNVVELEEAIPLSGEDTSPRLLTESRFKQLIKYSVRVFAPLEFIFNTEITAPPICPVLALLDVDRLTHLTLVSEAVNGAPDEHLLPGTLVRFKHLTHLKLVGYRLLVEANMSTLKTFDAPLRSLHLQAPFHQAQVDTAHLFTFVHQFKHTLHFLSVYGTCEDPPPADFSLPHLRHLRLATSSTVLLAPYFSSAPLEILDLGCDMYLLMQARPTSHPPTNRTLKACIYPPGDEPKTVESWPFLDVLVLGLEDERQLMHGSGLTTRGVQTVRKTAHPNELYEDLDYLDEDMLGRKRGGQGLLPLRVKAPGEDDWD